MTEVPGSLTSDRGSFLSQAHHRPTRPLLVHSDGLVALQFDATGVQSCMFAHDPYALALGYTRTMMGFVLFQPLPRRISIIGLGGGSLPKYCYRYLPDAAITVVEINPEVVALRSRFQIPPNDERFEVICADGAHYVTSSEHRPDVLLVDGFNADGMAPELCSRAFYTACRRQLADSGLLVANLMISDPGFRRSLRSVRDAFNDAVVLAPAEDSLDNVIAFAWKGRTAGLSRDESLVRARVLETVHPLNLQETAIRIEYGKSLDWDERAANAGT
ncbi:spermidine synthase [Paraburkholderia azotifigens]|uniref:Spermidine synthase n=2 Tax=Paraburkholderia azotifigens TaxID=2057004 RepID=A0ABU9QY48_9BURK|nr:spermidine synthase [Paraburkholderia azotifigens]